MPYYFRGWIFLNREQALNELRIRLSDSNLFRNSIAVEAVMRELAAEYNEDIDKWGMLGLLHNIDYELTGSDLERRGIIAAVILESLDIDDSIVYSIKSQNDLSGIARKRKMDKLLYAASPLCVLITASALVLSGKKISDLSVEFVLDKLNEKGFAEEADRGRIRSCEEIGMSLEHFIEVALSAMKKVAIELEF